MLKKFFYFAAMLWFSCFVAFNLHAEIYYWTDEKGVKHFSNEPPPKGTANIKKAYETAYEQQADEQRQKKDTEQMEALMEEFARERQTEHEGRLSPPGTGIRGASDQPPTREKMIQKEKERLEEIIDYLKHQPPEAFGNSRSRQVIIGRYRYKLEKLTQSPDEYFGW